ncbi:hypothetical protein METY_2286 [Methylopila sp. Yamaguchi]|nr:hypothetical protein METY_2286 [Methylopila sp. Yamaguchi]
MREVVRVLSALGAAAAAWVGTGAATRAGTPPPFEGDPAERAEVKAAAPAVTSG